MSCDVTHLLDPATGQTVSVITNDDGSLLILNSDGSEFGGDPTTLTPCTVKVCNQTRIDCEIPTPTSSDATEGCPDPAVIPPVSVRNVGVGGFGDDASGLVSFGSPPDDADPIVPADPYRTFSFTPTNADNCIVVITISNSYNNNLDADRLTSITTTAGTTTPWQLLTRDPYRVNAAGLFTAVHHTYWACVESTDPITVEMLWDNSLLPAPLAGGDRFAPAIAAWSADEICGICDKAAPFKQISDPASGGDANSPAQFGDVSILTPTLTEAPTCPTYLSFAGWHILTDNTSNAKGDWYQTSDPCLGVQIGCIDPDTVDLGVLIQGGKNLCQTGVITSWSGTEGCCPGYPAAGVQSYDVHHTLNAAGFDLTELGTARVYEINCCEYECPPESEPEVPCSPQKAIFNDGEITDVIVCAAVAPTGGDETYDIIVDEVVVSSLTLADGADSGAATGLPVPVTAGSKYSVELQSSTAVTPAECVTVSALIEEC